MKKIWIGTLCLCCLLCACGKEESETQTIQQQYAQVQKAQMDAEITCHLEGESRSFTVQCVYDKDGGAVTTVVAPEELAGISAVTSGEEFSVAYDGISLAAGEMVDVSPANCLPWLLRSAAEGYVLDYGEETIDGADCLRVALDTTGGDGGDVRCTVWFDRQTLIPCYTEFARDDRVVLTVRMLSFAWEAA